MTEIEFRSDKAAVKGLSDFLMSDTGYKFMTALEAESVLNKLSTAKNQTEAGVRDVAVIETGSADNLLGRCVGYNLVLCTIKRMMQGITPAEEKKNSTSSRVAKAMRANPTELR